MNVVCTDNRFEVIAAYKKMLTERTNIETSTDEMAVIDNVLFRFWQLGWLPPIPHGKLIDAKELRNSCYKHYSDFIDGGIDGKTALLNIEKEIIAAPAIIPASEEGE